MAEPIIDFGSLISINWDARLNGQQLLLTTNWRLDNDTALDPPTLTELYDGFVTWAIGLGSFDDQVAGVYSQDVTSITRIFQVIHPSRYIRLAALSHTPTGTVVEDSLPQNVAAVITLRGDLATPQHRSNKHIGGVPVSWVANGMIQAAGLTQYATLGTFLSQPQPIVVATNNMILTPIILHRAIPGASPEITNFILGTTSRIERRRTVGLGS